MSGIPKPSRLPSTRPTHPGTMSRRVLSENNHVVNQIGHGNKLKRNASPPPIGSTVPAKRAVHMRRSKSVVDLRCKSSSPSQRSNLARAASRPNFLETVAEVVNRVPAPTKPGFLSRAKTNLTITKKAPLQHGPSTTNASVSRVTTVSTRKPTTNMARTKTAPLSTTSSRPAVVSRTATKTGAAPAGSTGAKRKLAPYDYKGRFQELSERYETLKTKFQSLADEMDSHEDLVEKFDAAKEKLLVLEPELVKLRTEHLALSEDKQMLELKVERTVTKLAKTQEMFDEAKSELDFLRSESNCLKEENETLKGNLEKAEEDGEFFKNEFFRIEMERKRLHNTIMDLKGNIRVFARIRPPLENEAEKNLCQWNMHDETSFEMIGYDSIKKKTTKLDFTFDMVFHQKTTQDDIFENVSPLIQSALDGYNICIFAYGQTGSGKSYTMDGTRENLGIIPRTVDLLFDSIKHLNRCGWTFTVQASFLEIYNEVLCDLLDPKPKQMDIKMMNSSNTKDVFVSNIKEVTVTGARELRQLMETAKLNRITACTVGNERSSRSHAVTNITVIGRHRDRQWEMSKGTINLVDLAGSESPKVSTRMEETKNINRSLSELTNVMLALVKKSAHVPYRNSKLTHLLMPSLGGNSKTLMFVNVNPLEDSFQETHKSLRFAATVNSCTMAKAKRVKIFEHQDSGEN